MGYKIKFKFLKDRSFVKVKNIIENNGRVRLSNVKIVSYIMMLKYRIMFGL